MRKKFFILSLFLTPVFFFFGNRLLNYIIESESQESLGLEIFSSILGGCMASFGLWQLYRMVNKAK